MSGRVLVVDDDASIRTVVAQALRRAGYSVSTAESLDQLDRAVADHPPDVLVTDVVLSDGDGIDHMIGLHHRYPTLPIIVMSARNTLTTAIRAVENGAYEYLPKPFDLDTLIRAVADALAREARTVPTGEPDDAAIPLIGRSAAMQDVYRTIARVVPNDLTVLIAGESGTGKELVARAIHDLGPRRMGPFVAINMAAIPRDLIEAELFGHERGAFTGAAQRSSGRFEQAAGGTLFLDEIGDMPMDAQTRLLRVLQTGEFTTVGGTRSLRADVRIVAATNRDLAADVKSGRFREDLFYRLNVVPLLLPPLRERGHDVGLLAHRFLDQAAAQGLPRRHLSDDALAELTGYDWPGNVRELENMMRRLAVLARDEVIGADVISAMLRTPEGRNDDADSDTDLGASVRALIERIARERPGSLDDGTLYDRVIADAERPMIEAILARHGHNQLRAARALGINRNTLKKRMDLLGIASVRAELQ